MEWSEQQCRLLLEAVLAYRRGVPHLPQDVAWAEVIDYVPGKDCLACEQLVLLLYDAARDQQAPSATSSGGTRSTPTGRHARPSPTSRPSTSPKLHVSAWKSCAGWSPPPGGARRQSGDGSSSCTSTASCSAPDRVGARPDEVVRNIDAPNRNQNTSRGGLQRLPSGFVSSRPGSRLSFGEKLCVFPTRRGTRLRQVCGSRLRNAASVVQTHSGKKVSLLGLVRLHCRPKTHCVPMMSSTSSVTFSRLARMGTVCPARTRRTASPTTSETASCRRSRRSSVLYRVAPARARRARALSTGCRCGIRMRGWSWPPNSSCA